MVSDLPASAGHVSDLLARLEAYYDAVPVSNGARAERIGPLTLFIASGPWPYYARPSLGTGDVATADLAAVRHRMREVGVPESFEWVWETTPGMRAAAVAAGLEVGVHPLLVLAGEPRPPAGHADVRHVSADEPLEPVLCTADLAFGTAGTAVGPVGLTELAAASARSPAHVEAERRRLAAGVSVRYAAYADGSPVCTGTYTPVAGAAEIVGLGTLPAYRRCGLAAAVTAALSAHARRGGVELVFLSADDDAVARVYRRIGFTDVGTACMAEPRG